ncbi:TetR/AcrR family transcriptional regulator [Emcibacter nanhaiensis]|nr:TetR/AcrR family transcriptional regulator [Emcibacter nanhaiensis]
MKNGLRERKKQRTRAAVITQAKALFDRHGLDGTAMETIAADADISIASLYNYFPSKDVLISAIIIEEMEAGLVEAEQHVTKPAKSPQQAFLNLLKTYFETFQHIDRTLLRRFTAHAITHEASANEDYFQLEKALLEQIEQLTQILSETTAFARNVEPKSLAQVIFSIANAEYYNFIVDDDMTAKDALGNIAGQLQIVLSVLGTEHDNQ